MNNDEGYDYNYDREPTQFELWYSRYGLGRSYDELSNSERADVNWRYKEYLNSGGQS